MRRRNIAFILCFFLVLIIIHDLTNYTSIFSFSENEDELDYENETDTVEMEDDFDYLIKSNCPVQNNSIAYSCLKSLSDYKIKPKVLQNEVVYYHTFWKIDEEKSHHLPVLMLQMLSFLATQNIKKSQLIVWVQNYFNEKISKTIYNRFEIFFKENIIQIR